MVIVELRTHSDVLCRPLLLALETGRREKRPVASNVLLEPHLRLCHSTRHEKNKLKLVNTRNTTEARTSRPGV